MTYQHTPVLLQEVMEHLQPKKGQTYIDCTLGGGGYTLTLAQAVGKTGKIISLDLDKQALDHVEAHIKEHGLGNITLVHDNFVNLADIAQEQGLTKVNGLVLDLGLSSAQLADTNRGFAFQHDGPLDMTFGPSFISTANIVNKYQANKIQEIIKDYGEERYARSIAQKIVAQRKLSPITTTGQLVEIIASAVPGAYRRNQHLHFATRTFQALRIATNQELANLEKVLPQALNLLAPQGRLAVVSFHSLEDRIVKRFIQQASKDCICPPRVPVCRCGHQAELKIINKKIITASEQEIATNPRARSAKLRVAEKI
ncbi:MAG: 16S rRNA (cytosine(1402)-N(4))-methyltransferase RsmH [bacterium]